MTLIEEQLEQSTSKLGLKYSDDWLVKLIQLKILFEKKLKSVYDLIF